MKFQTPTLFSLIFVSVFLSTACRAEVVEKLFAIVNKKAIYKSDVQKFIKLKPLRMKVDPIFSNDSLASKDHPTDLQVVNYLVDEAIVSEKFPVQDAEVEQEINGIQGNLKIDREALKAAIAHEGFKFEEYFSLMRISLSKRQLLDREIRNKATVSDDDILAEYNRQHAGSKSFRGAFHLFVIRVLKKNYKSTELAKEQGKLILASLEKGDAFEDLAKKLSDDPTQASGGDMGFLSYSEMTPVLQKEVQKLGPGKTSELIEDQSSFMILKVNEVKADADAAFEKDKDNLRAKLLDFEFQHQIKLWLEHQRNLNFININIKT